MMDNTNDFINRIVGSHVRFAVVKLFKENPYVMDNLAGLALWVGKPQDMLEKELAELIDLGIVHRWGSEPGAIYAFTRDEDLRQLLEDQWCAINDCANELRWYRDSDEGSRGAEEA